MNIRSNAGRLQRTVLAHAALGLAASAHAQADPAWIELTQPSQRVELGIASSSTEAAKAHEYDGFSGKGPRAIGSVDLRGGGPFDSADATRWRLNGADLGLKSRSLEAEYGVQGRFRIRLGYDELLRNTSDSFQTPYLGVGTANMRLPSDWMTVVVPRLSATTPNARGLLPEVTSSSAIVSGALVAPTAAQNAAAAAMQAADLKAFREVSLGVQRKRHSLDWEQQINARWSLNASVESEHKEGLKALGAHSHATGGDVSSILPTAVNQDDRKASMGLSFAGQSLQLQAGFDVSSFKNNETSVSWNLWSGPGITETMSTAPSNLFQKAHVSANWALAPSTRLVGSASYSRMSQNEAFLNDPTTVLMPASSAQALVVNQMASLKLIDRSLRDLNLSAGYKYEQRENRTPVGTYLFYDNLEAVAGSSPFQSRFVQLPGLGSNINIAANTPYSRTLNQLLLDAQWRLRSGGQIKGAWTTSAVDRYCLGSWAPCNNAERSLEHSLQGDWSGPLGEDLAAQLGATFSRRSVNYNENAFLARVPMANQTPAGAPLGSSAYTALMDLGLDGWGPASGLSPAAAAGSVMAFYFPLNNPLSNTLYGFRNRITELAGMRRWDQADRQRSAVRARVNWQASQRLELVAGLDLLQDRYPDSTYGLTRLKQAALNVDGHYQLSETFSFNLFGSLEDRRTRMASNTYTANSSATAVNGSTAIDGGCYTTIALRNANNKIDACLDWGSSMRDRNAELGAGMTLKNLMAGRLDVTAQALWRSGRTDIDVLGGNYVNNPWAGVAGADNRSVAAYYVAATALPAITVKTLDLQVAGTWRLKPEQTLQLAYGYQRLRSSDWGYEGLQDGAQVQVLPTRESSPNHGIHRIGLSLVMAFR